LTKSWTYTIIIDGKKKQGGLNVKKRYLLLFAFFVLTAMFFVSCAEKGPTGTAGDPGAGVISVNLQEGVYPDASYIGTSDARLRSESPANNYGSCDNYYIGYDDTGLIRRAVVKFDLTTANIPAGAVITNAYLSLYASSFLNGQVTCSLYRITQAWTEGAGTCGGIADVNVSWNYYNGAGNSWVTAGGDYEAAAVSNAVNAGSLPAHYVTFSITPSVIQGWIDAPATNNGLLLKSSVESVVENVVVFGSAESTSANQNPRLTVYYNLP
jgi:hypothetical protein